MTCKNCDEMRKLLIEGARRLEAWLPNNEVDWVTEDREMVRAMREATTQPEEDKSLEPPRPDMSNAQTLGRDKIMLCSAAEICTKNCLHKSNHTPRVTCHAPCELAMGARCGKVGR